MADIFLSMEEVNSILTRSKHKQRERKFIAKEKYSINADLESKKIFERIKFLALL